MKKLILVFSMIALLTACSEGGSGGCDYFTGECYEPEYELNYDDNTDYMDDSIDDAPYGEYGDSYDQDCIDVGEEVWVGDYDPDGLDADGDGWGCEIWP